MFGRPTDAHLVHRFAKAGTYLLRVEAFAGQGGPDYSYQLKIAPGALPQETRRSSGGLGRARLDQTAGCQPAESACRARREAEEPEIDRNLSRRARTGTVQDCPARSKERWRSPAKRIARDSIWTARPTSRWKWKRRRPLLRSSIRSFVF